MYSSQYSFHLLYVLKAINSNALYSNLIYKTTSYISLNIVHTSLANVLYTKLCIIIYEYVHTCQTSRVEEFGIKVMMYLI